VCANVSIGHADRGDGADLEGRDGLLVPPVSEQVLGRLVQADDRHAQDGHDEHERAARVPFVPPALVVRVRARLRRQARVVRYRASLSIHASQRRELRTKERPREQPRNELPDAPPRRHEGEDPVVAARAELEEDRRVHDKISPAAERGQRHEKAEHDPIR
jgi:hypothetical protein